MTALDAMTIKMHLSELFVSTFSNETQKYQDIDKLRLIQSGLASQGTPVRTLKSQGQCLVLISFVTCSSLG